MSVVHVAAVDLAYYFGGVMLGLFLFSQLGEDIVLVVAGLQLRRAAVSGGLLQEERGNCVSGEPAVVHGRCEVV